MRIKHRLLIMYGIPLLLVIFFSLLMYNSFNSVAEENKRELIANEIHQTVSELNIIMYEYLVYGEERMIEQWNLRYETTAAIIESDMAEIAADYAALEDLFSQIVASYRKKDSPALEEKETRLVARLLIKSQDILFASTQIADEAYQNAIQAQKAANLVMVISLAVIVVLMTLSSLVIARRITQPLSSLVEITEKTAQGKFGVKADISTHDEIEDLAKSFNSMTSSLKNSTINTTELEKRIKQRTKELEQKNKELEKTLEDFYTMRIGLVQDLESGKVKEENKMIKRRLDKLRNLNKK